MKKILLFFTLIYVMLCVNIAYADKNELIDGLEENMETLWLKNYFTQEQMDDMVEQQQQMFIDNFYTYPWSITQTMWGVHGLNQEETLEYHLDQRYPHPNEGIRVYLMNTNLKYAKQYMHNENFKYLINDNYYWIVPQTRETCYSAYNQKGKFGRVAIRKMDSIISILEKEIVDFLKDYDRINVLLTEKNIHSVYDVKIIAPDSRFIFLYLSCDNGEYLIKIRGNINLTVEILPQIELFKIYTVLEVLDAIENVPEKDWQPVQTIQKYVLMTKETYQEEAESLQAEGLLKGTEKGLDLLKPLTRVEAATMLLRAMGEPETTESAVMTFSDVSTEHWGYGAVENAYRLGLVNGVGDGKFAPEENVTAPQFATMILRAADTEEFNWEQAVDIMIEQGILTKEETTTMDFFTRGDMAKMIYEARENKLF